MKRKQRPLSLTPVLSITWADRITQIVLLDFIKHYCSLYDNYAGH
jgi:hypothetical protein